MGYFRLRILWISRRFMSSISSFIIDTSMSAADIWATRVSEPESDDLALDYCVHIIKKREYLLYKMQTEH